MSEEKSLVVSGEKTYDVQAVADKVNAIRDLFKSVMVEGHHYGTIPGCDKPTLLKAGAEEILAMFSLAARTTEKIVREMPNGHREYEITTSLVSKKSGDFWGDGSGSCSTMESKFRWRMVDAGPIPSHYWQNRNNPEFAGLIAKKTGKGWLFKKRQENPDIADVYNTVLKMAEKRSLASAVLRATGASALFTQDMEDYVEVESSVSEEPPAAEGAEPKPEPSVKHSPAVSAPASGVKAPKLNFGEIQAKLSKMNNGKQIDEYVVTLHKTPGITPAQVNVIDKMANKRLEEVGDIPFDDTTPAGEMFPDEK